MLLLPQRDNQVLPPVARIDHIARLVWADVGQERPSASLRGPFPADLDSASAPAVARGGRSRVRSRMSNASMDSGRTGAMRRVLLICCGLSFALVAEVILWNGPHRYTNEEDKVPTALTQIAGVALAVQGAIVALVAALCLARALVPVTFSPAASGSSPAALGGGPVLPLCGLLFLVAGVGAPGAARGAA